MNKYQVADKDIRADIKKVRARLKFSYGPKRKALTNLLEILESWHVILMQGDNERVKHDKEAQTI